MADTYLRKRLNGKLGNIHAEFGNNKPDSAFSFLAAKIAVCPMIAQGGPTGWLAERKSSSLRSGIFFRQALPQSRTNRQHIQQEIKMPTHVGGCLT